MPTKNDKKENAKKGLKSSPTQEKKPKKQERTLDKKLEDTFPASDPTAEY